MGALSRLRDEGELGWEGTQALREDMDKGTLPSLPPSVFNWGGPRPPGGHVGTHTNPRCILPGNVVRWRELAS